ncbi:MAG TPA: c-type cytochrome biogenesis protein CcmI [Casimicrobiaceae bacterium]|nr:c-type cytochrome biogenesis protein CcmI [Casimicrobiaceae bacterium]
MLLFWSFASLLVAATLALLLFPLLRTRRAIETPDPDAAAAAVYRDQKQALDAEFADGVIGRDEHDEAVTELSQRLGSEIGLPGGKAAQAAGRVPWILVAALLVLIPAIAVVLYARLGRPEAVASAASERSAHDMSQREVSGLVDTLADRLKTRPDDAQGWVLLARSYHALGRYPEAAEAYDRATTLVPEDPGLLADYADVLAMTQGRRLSGKPAALAARALALDPNQKKALALSATAAMEARDLDGALALWQRLRAQFPEGSDDARQVSAIIAEVEGMKGGAPRTAIAAAPPSSTPAASGGAVAGRVDVSAALASRVTLTDTVFIYARASEGPRMPLAVLRFPAKQLPTEYRLDDSMGMAGAKLSAASSVIIEARISKSGNAIPQPGDLSGRSVPVKPGASGVNITIDQVVQ